MDKKVPTKDDDKLSGGRGIGGIKQIVAQNKSRILIAAAVLFLLLSVIV